jgi:hypothetical protein
MTWKLHGVFKASSWRSCWCYWASTAFKIPIVCVWTAFYFYLFVLSMLKMRALVWLIWDATMMLWQYLRSYCAHLGVLTF